MEQLLDLRETAAAAAKTDEDEEKTEIGEQRYSVRQLCLTFGVNRAWY
jgi:hypothetical protein